MPPLQRVSGLMLAVGLLCVAAGNAAETNTGGASPGAGETWNSAMHMAACQGLQAALADAYGALNQPAESARMRLDAEATELAARALFEAAGVSPVKSPLAAFDHALPARQRLNAEFESGGLSADALEAGEGRLEACQSVWMPLRDTMLEAQRARTYR